MYMSTSTQVVSRKDKDNNSKYQEISNKHDEFIEMTDYKKYNTKELKHTIETSDEDRFTDINMNLELSQPFTGRLFCCIRIRCSK